MCARTRCWARHLALLFTALATMTPEVFGDRGDDNTVLLREVGLENELTNPCQVTRTGAVLPATEQDEQRGLAELRVALHSASERVRSVREAAGVPECNGLQLRTLPRMSDISGLPRRQAMAEMYEAFMYQTAHLYLMVDEMSRSQRTCGNETLQLVEEVRALAGLLQNIVCVISENVPSRSLRAATESVTSTRYNRYRECTPRLSRNCLVLENISDNLSLSRQYLMETQEAQNNYLQPRMLRRFKPRLRVTWQHRYI